MRVTAAALSLCYVLFPCYATFTHTCSHLRHELCSSSIPSIFGDRSSSTRILSPSPCPLLPQARQWSGCARDDVSTPSPTPALDKAAASVSELRVRGWPFGLHSLRKCSPDGSWIMLTMLSICVCNLSM